MGRVKKRIFLWLFVILVPGILGYSLDSLYGFFFPIWIKVIGLVGILIAVLILRTSGRILKTSGKFEEWGWTTELVTHGIYSCVRHPHHFGIGLLVTFLGLLIGLYTFLLLTVVIWISIYIFLVRVEEPEVLEKFGKEYEDYRERVRMLLPEPICLLREILKKAGTR